MTLQKWLRKIALFPLTILMGVDAGASELSADTLRDIAGADPLPPLNERIMAFAGDPSAQFVSTDLQDAATGKAKAGDADHSGKQGDDGDDGLDTTFDEDDQDADLDDFADADDFNESEADNSEEVKAGTKKRTLEERAAEIAEKIVTEKLAAQEKARTADKPDYIVIDQEKVDEHIAEVEAKIDDLRLEGKYTEARKLSRQLDQLDADLEANDAKRTAWEAKQSANQSSGETTEAARRELDQAAILYRDEMKIEPALWDRMGLWFESQINTKPLLQEEFNDIYLKHGKVAAIRFAHKYAVRNMGQKTQQSNNKKEQLKNDTARLTSSTTGKVGPIDLKKAKAEFDANPTDEAFVKYQNLKRRAAA